MPEALHTLLGFMKSKFALHVLFGSFIFDLLSYYTPSLRIAVAMDRMRKINDSRYYFLTLRKNRQSTVTIPVTHQTRLNHRITYHKIDKRNPIG